MNRLIAVLALVIGPMPAYSQPSKDVMQTCVKAESTSPRVKYVDVPANEINESVDHDSGRNDTTIRFELDEMGTWETGSPSAFGLIYKGKQISLDDVARLSEEKPARFALELARWSIVSEGAKSYVCVTFNVDGLGRSGPHQSVRGVYLLDRNAQPPRAFYTVGRVTDKDVLLAR